LNSLFPLDVAISIALAQLGILLANAAQTALVMFGITAITSGAQVEVEPILYAKINPWKLATRLHVLGNTIGLPSLTALAQPAVQYPHVGNVRYRSGRIKTLVKRVSLKCYRFQTHALSAYWSPARQEKKYVMYGLP